MKKSSPILLVACLVPIAMLAAGGCSSGSAGGGTGGASAATGGKGTGGSTASGGATGSGGANASGGSTASGGATATGGNSGSGGALATGGSTGGGGTGGAAAGGRGGPGTGGGATGGSGGGNSGSGGATTGAFACPAGPFASASSPLPSGATATRIAGAPPITGADGMFNTNSFGNVEGPVWIGDALYFSEMKNGDLPPSRILKLTTSDVVSVFIADAGSNGLAVDGDGNIVSANHGAQGVVRFNISTKAPTTVVSTYGDKKFNCPNDLAIRKDGTIFFTDPTWQNNANPQGGTHVYQVAPGASTATIVTDYTNQPNGVTVSLDETILYVGGGSGVKKYAITNGQVAMTGTSFGPSDFNGGTDGMVLDCAGNLYVATSTKLIVASPAGAKIGELSITSVSSVTNVAFGGSDHQMLYITGQGNDTQRGVFKLHLDLPGMPY